MKDNTISLLGTRYHEWVRAHPGAAEDFEGDVEDLLLDAGVTFDRVSARVKSWASLKDKAKKRNPDGTLSYPDPWNDIHDLVGVRVNVFHSTEIPKAIDVLSDSFTVIRSVDKAAETRVSGGFGYGSHHLVLEVPDTSDDLAEFAGLQFEVQVRTVLQHAWAEFEHDIRYKQGSEPLDPRVDRAFALAAGLIELADQQFDQIAALKSPSPDTDEDGDVSDVPITAETLPGILAMLLGTRFPRSRSEHYRWLEELLTHNGLATVADLADLLTENRIDDVFAAMRYRYPPGQVRLIDDLLLQRFGEEHIERTGDTGTRAAQRARRLRGRLQAIRQSERQSEK